MTYWDMVIKELLNRHKPNATFYYIHRQKDKFMENIIKEKNSKNNKRITFALGNKYPGVTFSMQESECMVLALQGKSITKIASLMKLSPRTVEFYFSKMRLKLNCNSKADLIEKVMDSDFLKNKGRK